jgi:glycosyltransferase involved in cell wall biosynthesis
MTYQPTAPDPASLMLARNGGDLAAVTAEIFTAQMRRDQARLQSAQAEIRALSAQSQWAQSHLLRRVVQKARRAGQLLPAPVRAVLRHLLTMTRSAPPAVALPSHSTKGRVQRGRVLVIDDHWPQPNRDSGSVDIVNLVRSLDQLGFDVLLAAAREHEIPPLAREALIHDGIRCLTTTDAPSVEAFLAGQDNSLVLCVLCRVYCGGRFLEQALADARQARIVFNSIDLAFLREERRARRAGDEAGLAAAKAVRAREVAIIRASDATIVVSQAELELLAREVPEALVVQLPLARPLTPPSTPFSERRGIGFIGGFAHAPNIDAMHHFLTAIWPLVLRDLPEIEMTIVGADFPPSMLDGAPGRVRALGPLEDVGPWFEELRLTVAPLMFGAGAKGKVASSLAAGVPCIATPIAAEGMSLTSESGVLVAAEPEGFAARLRDAYSDETLWNRLSAEGLAYAKSHLSVDAWRERLDMLLRQMAL